VILKRETLRLGPTNAVDYIHNLAKDAPVASSGKPDFVNPWEPPDPIGRLRMNDFHCDRR
jgi:hypothetical protein